MTNFQLRQKSPNYTHYHIRHISGISILINIKYISWFMSREAPGERASASLLWKAALLEGNAIRKSPWFFIVRIPFMHRSIPLNIKINFLIHVTRSARRARQREPTMKSCIARKQCKFGKVLDIGVSTIFNKTYNSLFNTYGVDVGRFFSFYIHFASSKEMLI